MSGLCHNAVREKDIAAFYAEKIGKMVEIWQITVMKKGLAIHAVLQGCLVFIIHIMRLRRESHIKRVRR